MSSYFEKLEPLELSLAGKCYSLSFSASVTAAGILYLQIKTGSKQCSIMDWHVSGIGQPLTVEAIENPTLTNGTTPVVPYNMNRNSSATATTLFYSNPSSISSGTVIFIEAIASEKGSGGSVASEHVWTLKTNEDYLWKITNVGNNTATVSGTLMFSETLVP